MSSFDSKEVLHIYARVSSQLQVDKDLSIPEQIEIGKKIAKKFGLQFEVHSELGESASNDDLANRPVLLKLLERIDQGEIKRLYAFDMTRLSRNELTKALIYTKLIKNEVQLFIEDKKFDLTTVSDQLTYKIMEAVSLYDSAIRKQRFQLGYVSGSRKNRFMKPIAPYGYKKDEDGFLVVDEEEKKVFLMIVDWYLSKGYGTNKIANELNALNIPTKTSKVLKNGYKLSKGKRNRKIEKHITNNEWNAGTINSMLKNEIYAGRRRFKNGKEYEYVACEALISKEVFDRIQEKRAHNAISKHKEDKYFYLLKGRLQCGNCGNPLHGRIKPNRGEYTYRCNSKRFAKHSCDSRGINIQKLNDVVWDALLSSRHYHKLIDTKIEEFTREKDDVLDLLEDRRAKLEEITHKKAQVEKEISVLVKKSIYKKVKEDIFTKVLDEMQSELKIIENNQEDIQSQISYFENEIFSKKDFKGDFTKALELFNKARREISNLYPFDTIDKQVKAQEVIGGIIENVKVTYIPEKNAHSIEISFNAIRSLPDRIVSDELATTNRYVRKPQIQMDGIIILNEDSEFKVNYSGEMGRGSKKKSKNGLPPFYVMQQTLLLWEAGATLSQGKSRSHTMACCSWTSCPNSSVRSWK